jgi:hypothetical protein
MTLPSNSLLVDLTSSCPDRDPGDNRCAHVKPECWDAPGYRVRMAAVGDPSGLRNSELTLGRPGLVVSLFSGCHVSAG